MGSVFVFSTPKNLRGLLWLIQLHSMDWLVFKHCNIMIFFFNIVLVCKCNGRMKVGAQFVVFVGQKKQQKLHMFQLVWVAKAEF